MGSKYEDTIPCGTGLSAFACIHGGHQPLFICVECGDQGGVLIGPTEIIEDLCPECKETPQ